MKTGSSSTPLNLSLDSQGHIQQVSHTWAPPASPTHSNHLSRIPESSNSNTNSIAFTMDSDSQVKDYFPPLYTLPNRSSHSYEEECKAHNCEGSPPKEEVEPSRLRHHQRTDSWTMEDQKRVQHMKLMYGGGIHEAKTF